MLVQFTYAYMENYGKMELKTPYGIETSRIWFLPQSNVHDVLETALVFSENI